MLAGMRNRPASDTQVPSVPNKPPGGAPGVVLSSPVIPAPVAAPQKPAGGAPPKKRTRYRVLNGGKVTFAGHLTTLKAGKEIDDVQYDVPQLRRQGIRLEILQDEDEEQAAPAGPVAESPQGPAASDYERHETQWSDAELEAKKHEPKVAQEIERRASVAKAKTQ